MNPESPLSSGGRREFVKKSLAASIIAAQPSLLAGLIRAEGGGGQTTGLATTVPPTAVQTTIPDTTIAPDPYVLVCIDAPEDPTVMLEDSNMADQDSGPAVIDPYQVLYMNLIFQGPAKGDISFNQFHLKLIGELSAVGEVVDAEVEQDVGFNIPDEVTFTPQSPADSQFGTSDGRSTNLIVDLDAGRTSVTRSLWPGGPKVVDFGSGPMNATITPVAILPEGLGWSFQVMHLSEALEFQESLLE